MLQGVTEFLPISSSAHLILLPNLLGLPDQGLALDIAVHLGTLLAVIIFFWTDIRYSFVGAKYLVKLKINVPEAKLTLHLITATIPVVIIGFLIKQTDTYSMLRSVEVIGWNMIVFGLLLFFVDRHTSELGNLKSLTLLRSFVIGLFQAVSIMPGVSRSGVVITGCRLFGLNRKDSIKFSMLMSIPTILASGVILATDISSNQVSLPITTILIASSISFLSAICALKILLHFLNKLKFTPYIFYRLILGGILLYIAYT